MIFFDLSPGPLRARLRERLVLPQTGELVPETASPLTADLIPAAVLVPLVLHDTGPTVLLTRRTEHLQDHPGQISFPGGRYEPGDVSLTATALREGYEEVGLSPDRVEVLGALPEVCTGTGFCVTPVVGLVVPPLSLALDPFEVQEAFEVPLSFLMDEANHQHHQREVRGSLRDYVAMPYRDYFIWGATAGMLVSLHRVLTR